MPAYVLHYFDTRGLGEAIRQLLHLGGQEFIDKRYSQEEWPEVSKTMPFGKIPVLEIDGKPLPQSFAIARFLAKQFGYAGKTAFEQAWVDAISDQYKDYAPEIIPFYFVMVTGDKAKTKEALEQKGIPARDKFYPHIEKILKESKSGFLVCESLTFIDLFIADHVDVILAYVPDFFAKYPNVVAHRTKVYSDAKLKVWLAKRPQAKH